MQNTEAAHGRWTARQILVLAGIWFAFLISFITRLSWSTIMPSAIDSLHFTVQQGNNYLTAFYIGYAITVLPGGMLADKFGYKKLLMAAVLGNLVMMTAMVFMRGYWDGLALRFILGLVSGPDLSACLGIITEWFDGKKRATATGIFNTCTSFGLTVINLYAPSVMVHYGWRAALGVTAVFPLAALIFAYFAIKGNPPFPQQFKIKEANGQIEEETAIQRLKKAINNRSVWMLAITGLFATGAKWGVTNWANLFMVKSLKFNVITAGVAMSIFGITSVISMIVAEWISDHSKWSRHVWAAIFMAIFTPTIIGFTFIPHGNIVMLYFWTGAMGVGAFMFSTITNNLSVEVAPADQRGTVSGFINVFNQVGSFLAPVLLGQILASTGSYVSSYLIIAVFPLIAVVALLFVRESDADKNSQASSGQSEVTSAVVDHVNGR
ncbi:MFS transporter [Secundilactobacillus collinoides]|uniref:Major facilitator superfamily protein n=1 Tax=Secundilactobacillus collinoides DSM 20515 = JCM 1123 TaxID=1423733 RepID=A0A0R2B6U0_SECCO|nr:MFS transporter [Secundilactobacillus collinoides]KRM75073.1 major facilitator superfamily protein [Secundilactobacillus collinoides DSM 20515 = JCM 1123]